MSAGGGLRKRRVQFFVQVPRDTIRDRQLSFRARGLLAFLLDMPEGWDVKSEVLARETDHTEGEGREAIRTALKELGRNGYYRLERRRLRSGRFKMGTAISETPVEEWAREWADFEGEAVTMMEQHDGTFLVKLKDGSFVADGFLPADRGPATDTNVSDLPGDYHERDDVSAGHTGDGFLGAGFPAPGIPESGGPGSGGLGAIRKTEKGDREGSSESSLRSDSAAAPEEATGHEPGERAAEDAFTAELDVYGQSTMDARFARGTDEGATLGSGQGCVSGGVSAPIAKHRTGKSAESPEAFDAASAGAEWWWNELDRRKIPVMQRGKSNPFIALRDAVLLPAFRAGFTKSEVAKALQRIGEPVPSWKRFETTLFEVRGVRDVRSRSGGGRPNNKHVDSKVAVSTDTTAVFG